VTLIPTSKGELMELKQTEIIQILRRRAEMNQGTLGAKAFSTSYESGRTKIKNIELGKQIPTQADLKNMARVLGVRPTDLIPNSVASKPPSASSKEGLMIYPKTLERIPGLGPYLDMLNKAVALNDSELMAYIGEKIASILQTLSHREDQSAMSR
jgi:transcriptional regulator with XRE-family HTH domain